MFQYIKFIDKLNELIGKAASWLTLLLVLVVAYDVFSRYFLGESSVGVQELEWHIFAVIFLAAAAYTLKYDEHVRVDVLYTKFNPRTQAWINLFGSVLFLIPFAVIVIITSQNFVINSFNMSETSPDAGGLPARYILKSVIPLSFFLLFLQAIAQIFKSVMILRNKS